MFAFALEARPTIITTTNPNVVSPLFVYCSFFSPSVSFSPIYLTLVPPPLPLPTPPLPVHLFLLLLRPPEKIH